MQGQPEREDGTKPTRAVIRAGPGKGKDKQPKFIKNFHGIASGAVTVWWALKGWPRSAHLKPGACRVMVAALGNALANSILL